MKKTLIPTLLTALGGILALAAVVPHELLPALLQALLPDSGASGVILASTLAVTHPTLMDLKNTLDPKGKVATIIEMLNQTNEIIEDMVWLEANELTGHTSNIRTGLPTPTWRKLYGGVQPTKAGTRKVKDTLGMLEDYAEVDKKLVELNGNSMAFRLQEDRAHIEGINQEFASTLFYGNEGTEPEAFTGFAPRFNTNDTSVALNAENVIAPVTTPDNSDNTSIWLVVWGPATVHGIYSQGGNAGIIAEDLGRVTIENVDGAGGRMEGYRSHYGMEAGLVVRDWRYVVRIQVDQEDLVKDAATGPDLTDLMVQALEIVPSLSMGRPAFYMNRSVRSWLRRQMTNKTKNSTLAFDTMAGKRVLTFDGVPCRRCDAITNTEAGV